MAIKITDCNPYWQEEYALYLALDQLITPSSLVNQSPMTLETFRLLHPIATHRMFQQMAQAIAIESGLTPVPLVEARTILE